MKHLINLGKVNDSYYGTCAVAAVYGGDIRYGTIGSATAPDAKWHLAMWGAFDRNMVGAYWFVLPEISAREFPGLWEKYLAAIKPSIE